MLIILGVDPGLTKTGWGVVKSSGNSISYISSGTIKSSADQDIFIRLNNLHKIITEVMDIYKPMEAAIEKTFVNKNPLSSLKLGQARGALMLSLSMKENLIIKEYASTEVKKVVVGVGRADKNQVKYMVKMILPTANIKSEDEADALAVAICHINSTHLSGRYSKTS